MTLGPKRWGVQRLSLPNTAVPRSADRQRAKSAARNGSALTSCIAFTEKPLPVLRGVVSHARAAAPSAM
jgi:hypothetical protein